MIKTAIVIATIVGLLSSWLRPPFDSAVEAMMWIGVLVLVVATHRAAFRTSEAGLFGFWLRPIQTAMSRVDEKDYGLLVLGLVLLVSPMVSMFLHVVFIKAFGV